MRWIFMLLFVVGCGEVKAKQPDGGSDDAGTDANPDAPQVGDATVAVTVGGVAQSGLRVNFQAEDGSLGSEAMTDVNGTATASVHTNAMVTVAVGPNDLITVTGVNPGDQIVLKSKKPYDDTVATNVAFSASSEAPGKSFYRADLGGDFYQTIVNMTTGGTLPVERGMLDGGGKFHILAAVYNTDNKLVGYGFVSTVPGTTGTTTVRFSTWLTDIVDINVQLSDAPADATKLFVRSANEQSGMLYVPSGFPAGSPYPSAASIVSGSAACVVPSLGSFGDFVQTEAIVEFGTGQDVRIVRRVPRPAGAFVIDGNDLPARIATAMVDSSTATRPVASWTFEGSTANGDANLVVLSWKDATGGSFRWHVYVPPDATTFTFPAVSVSIAAQAPAQTSTGVGAYISQHGLEPLAGYAEFHLAPPIDYTDPFYPHYADMPPGFHTWISGG